MYLQLNSASSTAILFPLLSPKKTRLLLQGLMHQNITLKLLMQTAQQFKQENAKLCFTKSCHVCVMPTPMLF